MSNVKITPSMVTLWHVAATVAGGVMLPILLGLFQYASSHGANVGQDISYGIPVLVGGLATLPVSIWHAIQNNPALPQAEKDVSNQAIADVKNMAHEALTRIENMWPVLHDLNTRQTAQEAATKAVPPASVPQVPFPVMSASVPTNPPASVINSAPASTMLNTFPMMPAVPKP